MNFSWKWLKRGLGLDTSQAAHSRLDYLEDAFKELRIRYAALDVGLRHHLNPTPDHQHPAKPTLSALTERCPKCGHAHLDADSKYSGAPFGVPFTEYVPAKGKVPEHLKVACSRCGYTYKAQVAT